MSSGTYTVQPGDTPMLITQKLLGNPTRMNELVRSNAHKATVRVGNAVTFQELTVGERLTIPPRWAGTGQLGRGHAASAGSRPSSGKAGSHKKHPSGAKGVSGHAYPQRAPHFAVRPRAGADGGGDDSGHGVEPILTVMGVGQVGACCGGCARGGPCETTCQGASCAVPLPPCSASQAQPSIPGSTSFPVGFGQTNTSSTTSSLSTVGDALSGWGVPLAVGAVSIAAGFGLAWAISHR